MANHITKLRTAAGIKTTKEAANKLNISPGMMYQVEEDIKTPSSTLRNSLISEKRLCTD